MSRASIETIVGFWLYGPGDTLKRNLQSDTVSSVVKVTPIYVNCVGRSPDLHGQRRRSPAWSGPDFHSTAISFLIAESILSSRPRSTQLMHHGCLNF